MTEQEIEVLDEHGLSQAQWAVLTSTHAHTAFSWNAVVAGTAVRLPREWRLSDVAAAVQDCFDRGWVGPQRTDLGGKGIALTREGHRIKTEVQAHLRGLTRQAVPHAA